MKDVFVRRISKERATLRTGFQLLRLKGHGRMALIFC
jgi:hypothetical protein